MAARGRALIVVPLVIGVVAGVFAVVGYFGAGALGVPARLHLPAAVRAAGAGVLALGFAFLGWVYRYRSPLDVLTSTYLTMCQAARRAPTQQPSSRTEPLVLLGPQRHVRHPMYFAVVVLFLGWWLLLDYTFLLFMAVLFLLWFTLVVIRFEERELRALFGEEYSAYARAVPMILPSLKPRWR
jgi:protein-S-isoprenylcysteine O-methyltransferase Ste14